MFPIHQRHIRRVSFATKLFPRVNSSLGIGRNEKKSEEPDAGSFCGGRSVNKELLTLFGLISESQRGASTFVQLPLFRRSVKKLTGLVERELEAIGAHEVLLPTLIPQKLWLKSKRLERQQDALSHVYNFKDNSDNELLLGPTYEESITQLVCDLDPAHERELPFLLYQTSQKFRYEPNPKFGLVRSNEFLMNDLYSFDIDLKSAKKTYELVSEVYRKIFSQLGLHCLRFESVTGNIGGSFSHEYQLPVSSGEDHVIRCNSCSHAYNTEMCLQAGRDSDKCLRCDSSNIQRMQTLELAHTFLLSDTYSKAMMAQIKREDGTKVNYEMGCFGLGLTRILGAGLDLYSIAQEDRSTFIQMRWPSRVEPFRLGIVPPARRSKQFNAGSSDFIKSLTNKILSTTSDVDVLVEDRDKEGIFRRLVKLQSLGIPNIITVGQRFLEETPQVEVLKLTDDKKDYEQHWMTEEQVLDFVRQLDVYS